MLILIEDALPLEYVYKPSAKVKNLGDWSLRDAIVACVERDDSRGKEFIYKKYYGYLMSVVFRYIRDAHEAEELVNESFLKGFRAIGRFKVNAESETIEKPFMGWLARIASNLCIDHLRAKKALYLVEDNLHLETPDTYVIPSQDIEIEEIMALLNRLPDIQRIIFILFEIEGYSHEEIAARLNIPESTSRTYLTRGKQKLRTYYKKLYR